MPEFAGSKATKAMNGILPVDKPAGWTSHDVVARVRRLSVQRRVGHAGTLDPMATGVLLVCMGEATRLSDHLMQGVKWYVARVWFGTRTNTDDALGEVISRRAADFSRDDLARAAGAQVGNLQQVPPDFSAIKQGGAPVYKSARAGVPVSLAPRSVTVYALIVLSEGALPDTHTADGGGLPGRWANLLICCGKGTYIRSIARDLGEDLDCGAHLAGLRRLASGGFTTRHCARVDQLQAAVEAHGSAALHRWVATPDAALASVPACVVDRPRSTKVRSGLSFQAPGVLAGDDLRVYADDGSLIALAGAQAGGFWHPDRVFNVAEAC